MGMLRTGRGMGGVVAEWWWVGPADLSDATRAVILFADVVQRRVQPAGADLDSTGNQLGVVTQDLVPISYAPLDTIRGPSPCPDLTPPPY